MNTRTGPIECDDRSGLRGRIDVGQGVLQIAGDRGKSGIDSGRLRDIVNVAEVDQPAIVWCHGIHSGHSRLKGNRLGVVKSHFSLGKLVIRNCSNKLPAHRRSDCCSRGFYQDDGLFIGNGHDIGEIIKVFSNPASNVLNNIIVRWGIVGGGRSLSRDPAGVVADIEIRNGDQGCGSRGIDRSACRTIASHANGEVGGPLASHHELVGI